MMRKLNDISAPMKHGTLKYIRAAFFIFNFSFLIFNCAAQSPDFVNNGAIISNLNGNIIHVNGDITNQASGIFENTGNISLTGDWTNNAGNPAFSPTPGGTVLLVGGNEDVQGSDVTEFYNLTLLGGGVKQLNGIDAIIENILALNDREFATNTNTAYVTSAALAAITRTSGFVSSLGNGALVRYMNQNAAYLFPVGSSIFPARFRPVEIKPDSAFNAFAVRFANLDATIEGFNILQKQSSIEGINPLYYHRIRRDSGTSAPDITIYYDVQDGNFISIGHWQNLPQWEDMSASPSAGNYGLNALTKQAWNDFSYPAFALILNECGDIFVPTAFSPNGDNQNDLECVYNRCIKNITFSIYDRWGEKVFETTDPKACWDGTYRGKPMNTGVFVYYLQADLVSGESVTKKGNIGLVR